MASKPKDRGRRGGRRRTAEDRRRRKEIHREKGKESEGKGKGKGKGKGGQSVCVVEGGEGNETRQENVENGVIQRNNVCTMCLMCWGVIMRGT